MERNLNAAKEAMERSDRQSKAAIDASIEASRNDQRAWLTFSRFLLSEEPTADKEVAIDYWIINTGKTPAIDMYTQGTVWILPSEMIFPFGELADHPKIVVPPNAPNMSTRLKWKFAASFLTNYPTKVYRLYFNGLVLYHDIFGELRWTSVCAWHEYGESLDHFSFCSKGNETDKDQRQSESTPAFIPTTTTRKKKRTGLSI